MHHHHTPLLLLLLLLLLLQPTPLTAPAAVPVLLPAAPQGLRRLPPPLPSPAAPLSTSPDPATTVTDELPSGPHRRGRGNDH